MTIVTKPNTD